MAEFGTIVVAAAAMLCVLIVPEVPLTVGVPVGDATAITVVLLDTNDTVFVAFAVTVQVPLSSVVVASARPAIVMLVPTGKAAPAPVAVTVAVAEPAVRAAAVIEIGVFVAPPAAVTTRDTSCNASVAEAVVIPRTLGTST